GSLRGAQLFCVVLGLGSAICAGRRAGCAGRST
ncbi:hypothetical protein A2U01_0100914, partial [Trifolium medium]|nr:hypothetical protein [Trifolium medium]